MELTTSFLYFYKSVNVRYRDEFPDASEFYYIGWTDGWQTRHYTHCMNGDRLIAVIPATKPNEKWLHDYFAKYRVNKKRESHYFVNETITKYIDNLLLSAFAFPDFESAQEVPYLDFNRWKPDVLLTPVDPTGKPTLLPAALLEDDRKHVYLNHYGERYTEDDEWGTPVWLVELIREVFDGKIDTDPATNKVFQQYIKADKWFTKDHNGRTFPWNGNVLFNPPLGQETHEGEKFVYKLIEEYEAKRVRSAIALLNLPSAENKWFQQIWKHASIHAVCVGRIQFIAPKDKKDKSPSKGTWVAYIGPDPDKFGRIFGSAKQPHSFHVMKEVFYK